MQEGAARDIRGPGVDVGRYNEERRATEMVTDDTREAREMGGVLSMDGAAVEGEPVASAVAGEDAARRVLDAMSEHLPGLVGLARDAADGARRLEAIAGEGGCSCPPGARAAFVYDRTCPDHGDNRTGQTIVLASDGGATGMAAGLAAMAGIASDPSPTSPSPADLTASFVSTYCDMLDAHNALALAKRAHALAIDAKARSLPKGGFCAIGGVTYRAKPPRKAKGQAGDSAAMWTLERVEVVE